MAKRTVKEIEFKKTDHELPQCPHCKVTITNYMTVFYGRKYSCNECKGKYYLIKLSNILYTNF